MSPPTVWDPTRSWRSSARAEWESSIEPETRGSVVKNAYFPMTFSDGTLYFLTDDGETRPHLPDQPSDPVDSSSQARLGRTFSKRKLFGHSRSDEFLDEPSMKLGKIAHLRFRPSQRPGGRRRARFLQHPGQS